MMPAYPSSSIAGALKMIDDANLVLDAGAEDIPTPRRVTWISVVIRLDPDGRRRCVRPCLVGTFLGC